MSTATPISRSTLADSIAAQLRERILTGEFSTGDKLPGETHLASEYRVHRSTVRGALNSLAANGLIETRHGSGSYVLEDGREIRAGLQDLRSMSDTIREMGHEPGMVPHATDYRPASAAEREKLGLAPSGRVLELQRTVLADGIPVAFSYDVFPAELFPTDVVADLGSGSVFAQMRALGCEPVRAVAHVNAVDDESIGWGEERPDKSVYLLLDQIHRDVRGRRVVWSKTYFVPGAFHFIVLRTR